MESEDLRLAVYRTFADTGRAPRAAELAEEFGAGLLARGAPAPFPLPPFGRAAGILGHGRPHAVVGRLCLGFLALPHLLPGESEMLVATRCPACQRPHAWNVSSRRPPDGEQVAHFLVPAARMWDDVVRTCGHQRLFCSEGCVDAWLADTGYPRGYVMDLGTLWRLAAHWYDGRLERGYVRREPSQAAAYLRGVGLAGPFWGL